MNKKQKYIVGELLQELHIDTAVESLLAKQAARVAELEAENTQLRELVRTATVYFVADQSHKVSWLNRALTAITPKGE